MVKVRNLYSGQVNEVSGAVARNLDRNSYEAVADTPAPKTSPKAKAVSRADADDSK